MRDLRRVDLSTLVLPFGRGTASRALLGTEGAGLARLCELGLPTPPGFTISTEAWRAYAAEGALPAFLRDELRDRLPRLQDEARAVLGEPAMPLLVSVRVSAPTRVPGLLGPILDVGIGEGTVDAVADVSGRAFAGKRRLDFLRGFATQVRGLPADEVEAPDGHDDPVAAARALADRIAERSGAPVPDDLEGQLAETLVAAWDSWRSPAAEAHRERSGLPGDVGVAVVVQTMVHGDRDLDSGVGVAFSRDPTTGSPSAAGRFLPQGTIQDTVAGRLPLAAMRARLSVTLAELDAALPLVEASYRDMCSVDFAVQSGRLWFLRAKPGRRSGPAAVRIAVDLVDDGLITTPEALARIPLPVMTRLQAPVFASDEHVDVLAVGEASSPGAACGVAAFSGARALALAAAGADVVLLLPRVGRGDVAAAMESVAVVTSRRETPDPEALERYGRPAIFGAAALEVDEGRRHATAAGRTIREGDVVAVDGTTGVLMAGPVRMVPPQPDFGVARILQWADERRGVELLAAPPAGALLVRGVGDVPARVDGPVAVDVGSAADGRTADLTDAVTALVDAGARSLTLVYASGEGADRVRPPAGPWTGIAADRRSWAARLLAGRIEVVGAG